jgi:Putative peptidoglycan binding domain
VRNATRNRRQAEAEEDDEEFDRPAGSRPWWWRLLLRRPRDTLAFLVMAGAAAAIVVNGVYLQHGRHPAPMFAVRPLPVAAAEPDVVGMLSRVRSVEPESARHDAAAPHARTDVVELPRPRPTAPATVAPARKDAIAELIATHPVQVRLPPPEPAAPVPPAPIPANAPAPPSRSLGQPSRQVLAVQRALSEFGYGQIKPTGVFDAGTRLAIQRFERDHNLPVNGEISNDVKRELATLTGHPID